MGCQILAGALVEKQRNPCTRNRLRRTQELACVQHETMVPFSRDHLTANTGATQTPLKVQGFSSKGCFLESIFHGLQSLVVKYWLFQSLRISSHQSHIATNSRCSNFAHRLDCEKFTLLRKHPLTAKAFPRKVVSLRAFSTACKA